MHTVSRHRVSVRLSWVNGGKGANMNECTVTRIGGGTPKTRTGEEEEEEEGEEKERVAQKGGHRRPGRHRYIGAHGVEAPPELSPRFTTSFS